MRGVLSEAWRVDETHVDARRVRVIVVHGETGARVEFALWSSSEATRAGPFDAKGQRISYGATDVPFERLRLVGGALRERLCLAAGAGDPSRLVQRWIDAHLRERARLPVLRTTPHTRAYDAVDARQGAAPARGGMRRDDPWGERLRELLVDRDDAVVRLGDVLSDDALPSWPCALPWTRLELNDLTVGPCCSDYQTRPDATSPGASPASYWNGPTMRAFRRAMAGAPPIATCRTTCPYLRGGAQSPAEVVLFGGPASFVARELELVEDMLAGREVLRGGPLKVSFTTTTYCNYDCLMCTYGELGTLDDELPRAFYDELMDFAPGLRLIEALGGEPLASPVFREFLADFDFARHPALRVALVTNGSYLTPKEQARLRRVPFDNLTISLNAATPETYLAVNRGLSWTRVRENLDALLQRRRDGELRCAITYSMVILRQNLAEVRAFAELARRDGVGYRYLLPNYDRNGQSIFTSREAMTEALAALEAVIAGARALGQDNVVGRLLGEVRVLEHRLANNLVAPIPDGLTFEEALARRVASATAPGLTPPSRDS